MVMRRAMSMLDRVGAIASSLCAIHCIALPYFLTILPLVGFSFLASPRFELFMIVSALSIGTISLGLGARHHRKFYLLFLLLFAAVLFYMAHDFEEPTHSFVMAAGGICLAIGHVLNRRLYQSCTHCLAV